MRPTSPSGAILLALLASAATTTALRPAAHEGAAERRGILGGRAHAGKRLVAEEGNAPAVDRPQAASAGDAEGELLRSSQAESNGQLSKRSYDSAACTFYYTSVGAGACGETHPDTDWTIAMNTDQYDSGSVCGQTVTLTYNGKTYSAPVKDECPSCPYGGLDLSPSFFQQFASEDVGEFYGSWVWGDSSSDDSATTTTTSSEAAWTATATSTTETYTPPTTTSTSTTPAWTPETTTSSTWTYTPPTTLTTSTSSSASSSSAVFFPSSSSAAAATSSSASSARVSSALASGFVSAGASGASSASASASSSSSSTTADDSVGDNIAKFGSLVAGLGSIVCAGHQDCQAN